MCVHVSSQICLVTCLLHCAYACVSASVCVFMFLVSSVLSCSHSSVVRNGFHVHFLCKCIYKCGCVGTVMFDIKKQQQQPTASFDFRHLIVCTVAVTLVAGTVDVLQMLVLL